MTGNVPIEVDEAVHAAMLDGIIEAMLFSGLDDGEEYGDIDPYLRRKLSDDCAVFLYLLDVFGTDRPARWIVQSTARSSVISEPKRAGNDLWFTRSGDGVGFWDGDWDDPSSGKFGHCEIGNYLTWIAKLIPQIEVYVGEEDKVIYGTW